MNKTLSGRLRECKNERKVQLGNPKSGRGGGRLREQSLTRAFHFKVLKEQFKRAFTKVVLTVAGRLREWSQGELQLYISLDICL